MTLLEEANYSLIPSDILLLPSLTNSSRIGFSWAYRIAVFDRNRFRSSLSPLSDRIQRIRSRGYCEEPTTATPYVYYRNATCPYRALYGLHCYFAESFLRYPAFSWRALILASCSLIFFVDPKWTAWTAPSASRQDVYQ